NQVEFDHVFVPEHRLLGTEGDGWRQVIGQLSFERGGAERYLSSYVLFAEFVRRAQRATLDQSTTVGSLSQRLAVLRRLAFETATSLDQGKTPVAQAAALKLLGNQFEVDVVTAF